MNRMRENMRIFGFYVSGILYGKIRADKANPEKLQICRLDFASGQLSDWDEFTDEDWQFYKSLVKVDFRSFFSQLDQYDSILSAAGDFTLPSGERYTSEDGCFFRQRDIKFPNNKLVKDGRVIAVTTTAREMVTVVAEEGYEDDTILSMWKKSFPDERIYGVNYLGMTDVVTRDGVTLSTDVFLPQPLEGKVQTILVRTPYGKEDGREGYYRYVQRGYAVVIQDVRGRNLSEGEWMPHTYEVEDGDDTLNWIADQDWSDGTVGTVGGSYLGFVQWAAAASGNPHLKAMISVVTSGNAFTDNPRTGGSLCSGVMAWAFAVSQKKFKPELMDRDDWEEILNIRPLTDIPKKVLGYEIPFMEKWVAPRDYDDFWRQTDWKARSKGAVIPVLIQSGWFDDNGMATTDALDLTENFPVGMRKVILGPWQHSGNSRYDLHGVSFGKDALRFDLDLLYFQWLDHFLRGVDNGIERTAPVEYYVVGKEEWRQSDHWPVSGTKEISLYLDSDGSANTSEGDGRISLTKPEKEGNDSYDYDPENPSIHIIDMSENEIEVPEDYTEEEKRQDMLCYTSDVLTEEFTITGDLTAELYISSDAPDTDFMVRLTDVDENGRSIKLADGILSARYRNGFEHSEFLTEGEIVCLRIRTTKISNCFLPGHRIRITITSSAKNLVFPNSNTREGFNSAVTQVARNKVYHGGVHASRVIVRR